MYRAIKLVGPGPVRKNALDTAIDFRDGLFLAHYGGQTPGNFVRRCERFSAQ